MPRQFFSHPRVDYFASLCDRLTDLVVHRFDRILDRLLIDILVVEVGNILVQLLLEIFGKIFERRLYVVHLSADGIAQFFKLFQLLVEGRLQRIFPAFEECLQRVFHARYQPLQSGGRRRRFRRFCRLHRLETRFDFRRERVHDAIDTIVHFTFGFICRSRSAPIPGGLENSFQLRGIPGQFPVLVLERIDKRIDKAGNDLIFAFFRRVRIRLVELVSGDEPVRLFEKLLQIFPYSVLGFFDAGIFLIGRFEIREIDHVRRRTAERVFHLVLHPVRTRLGGNIEKKRERCADTLQKTEFGLGRFCRGPLGSRRHDRDFSALEEIGQIAYVFLLGVGYFVALESAFEIFEANGSFIAELVDLELVRARTEDRHRLSRPVAVCDDRRIHGRPPLLFKKSDANSAGKAKRIFFFLLGSGRESGFKTARLIDLGASIVLVGSKLDPPLLERGKERKEHRNPIILHQAFGNLHAQEKLQRIVAGDAEGRIGKIVEQVIGLEQREKLFFRKRRGVRHDFAVHVKPFRFLVLFEIYAHVADGYRRKTLLVQLKSFEIEALRDCRDKLVRRHGSFPFFRPPPDLDVVDVGHERRIEALEDVRDHIVRLVALRGLGLEIDHRLLREAVVGIHLRFDIGDELARRTARRLGNARQTDLVIALGKEIVIRNVRPLELGVFQVHGRIGRVDDGGLDLGQALEILGCLVEVFDDLDDFGLELRRALKTERHHELPDRKRARRSVGIRNSLNRIVIGGKTRLTFRKMILNPSFMARIIYEKIDRVSCKRHKLYSL